MRVFAPQLEVMENADAVAARAAAHVIATLRAGKSTLGLATGATMAPLYARLVAAYRAGTISFKTTASFNLDEYVGLAPDFAASFSAFMQRHFWRHVDLAPGRAHIPDGTAPDMAVEAARYEALIALCGGIDLQVLGIGANGHIGFNEPGSEFSSRTREVRLDEATRLGNAAVPERAITMGIATILEAREILLLATGAEKAAAIAAAIEGPITPACPASALRLHGNVHILCDRAAAAALATSLRANGSRECAPVARSNPEGNNARLDCFRLRRASADAVVASAPRNNGSDVSANLSTSLRAQRSNPGGNKTRLDCFRLRRASADAVVASAPRNDGSGVFANLPTSLRTPRSNAGRSA